MAELGILKIDGVIMPDPLLEGYGWELNDISSEDSGRTMKGQMIKKRVAQKRKLSCKWPPLSLAEASKLLKAANPVYLEVTFFDLKENKFITKTCYTGDRSCSGFFTIRKVAGKLTAYVTGLAFDFIEV
nr:MAG TPA: hypothetical protein [Bacteriophage sp.]